jgi:hypothetical protein
MMVDQNLVGQCGAGQLVARDGITDRYYPDWRDNDFATQKLTQRLLVSFREYSRNRRPELIEQEENDEGMDGACPLIMWRWNEEQEGPERVRRSSLSAGMSYSVNRGPYDSNSVWNLLDAAMEADIFLLTVKDFSNVL